MLSIFRLVRLRNLIIIAGTMYLIRYFLVGKMLDLRGLWLGLSDFNFFLLAMSVVMIAAAGYIINDYFDVQADSINKPEKIIVGKDVSRATAFNIYIVLNILGVMAGLYLAIKINFIQLGLINLLSAGLLWFYTTVFKKAFLLGNLVVSVLTAMVPLTVGLFEPNRDMNAMLFVLFYAAFAFIMNLVREIIKDVEDMEGDRAVGCKTIPIVLGITASKIISIILILFVMAFLGYVEYNQYITRDSLSFWYFSLAISLPLLILIIRIIRSSAKEDFGKASSIAKLIMITGLLSTVIFYLSF